MSDEPRHPYRKLFRIRLATPFIVASVLLIAQRVLSGATREEVPHMGGCLPTPWHVISGKPVGAHLEQ